MARRDYEGNAVPTTLPAGIASDTLSFDIASSVGWPTGGAAGKFIITIDRGLSNEERILASSRTANVITIASTADRGIDGTSPSAHNPNAPVEHTFSSLDADEANQHINDTSLDHHTQYLKTASHDLPARHTFGGAFAVPSAPPDISTGGSSGAGSGPARSDHTHKIGSGAINAAAMFLAGVVNAAAVAADAISTVKIQDLAVTAGKIADSAVTAVKLAVDSVTTDKIANNAVTTTKILDVNVTGAKLADLAVTALKLADLAVTTAKIQNLAVTRAKLASSVLHVQTGSTVGTTSSVGDLTITYSGFASAPGVVAVAGDFAQGVFFCQMNQSAVTPTSAKARCTNADGVTVKNTSVRVNWVAVGVPA